jgi:type IV pilus assembly protein PilC
MQAPLIDYHWRGLDREGKPQRGELQASGETQVRVTLRRQGIKLTKLQRRRLPSAKRIRKKDIAIFTRQLAAMMKAGVPLLQAFDIAAQGHANPAFEVLVRRIRQSLEAGSSLTTAFRQHPQHFDELYCSLIQAGERGGILVQVLERVANYMEKNDALRAKIKAALIYPFAVLSVALVVVVIIVTWVIPNFQHVFSSMGSQLPLATRVVIGVSHYFNQWWWLFGLLLGGVGLWLRHLFAQQGAKRLRLDQRLLRLPVVGEVIKKTCVARWTRTLSTMFGAGVPLGEALDTVAQAAGNQVFLQATQGIALKVNTGTSLSAAMRNARVFPGMVLQMCQVGEEAGELDAMLTRMADFYDTEVDEAVTRMTKFIEPVLFVFLGALIGGIMLAMYMPIFTMGQQSL